MGSDRTPALAHTAADHLLIATEYIEGIRSSADEFGGVDAEQGFPFKGDQLARLQAIELVDAARAQAHLALATYLRDDAIIRGASTDRRFGR